MENQQSHIIFVLRVGRGSFAEGFPVTLQVFEDGSIVKESQVPDIPVNAALPSHYQRWRSSYNQLGNTRKIAPVAKQQTHGRLLEDCRDATSAFAQECELWFTGFESLRKSIWAEAKARSAKRVPVFLDVRTGSYDQDTQLRKVPWHLWKLFDTDLPDSEMILNAGFSKGVHQLTQGVNILAIFGSAEGGLQLDKDLTALEQLQGAKITALQQPSRESLHEHLWQGSWDIIAFAGHSASAAGYRQGHIQYRDDASLPLSALKEDLKYAVAQGLKLAIFNSCDGLGIADYLSDLQVPTMIVMREPVPDTVARKFLGYFLESFSNGALLHTAVRTARKRIHWLESNNEGIPCPAATWLPIVCQNPNQPPLQWPEDKSPGVEPDGKKQVANQFLPNPTSRKQLARAKQQHSEKTMTSNTKFAPFVWFARGGVALFLLFGLFSLIGLFEPEDDIVDRPPPPVFFAERISQGDKSLIVDEAARLPESLCQAHNHRSFNDLKALGMTQMASQQYRKAAGSFQSAFTLCPGPETLIYQQNAEIKASGLAPYTIAVSLPISGANPNNALEMLRGVAQAQKETNDSSEQVGGRPLEIILLDDEDDSAVAKEIANNLIENHPEVLGVVGHWTSDVSLAAAAVYEQKQELAFVTPISTTNALSNFSPWVFRSTINGLSGSRALADHMTDGWGLQKAAMFCVDKVTYSTEICSGFKRRLEANGGEVVAEFNLGDANLNIDQVLGKARKNGAEVILLASNNSSVDQSINIIKANRGRLKVLGDLANLYTVKTLQQKAAQDMVMGIAWHPDGDADPEFLANANSLWGGRVNYVTALTYGTVHAVAQAIANVPTRNGVQAQLRDPNFRAISADSIPMTFESTGDRPAPVQLVEVQRQQPSLSGTGADFIPIK